MQRKFVLNLIFLLSLNFLIKPFWLFGIDRTVQNTVDAESYGLYFTLFNFSLLFNILLDLGITNFNNRNISQHSQLLVKYFSGIVVFKFLLACIYLLVTFVSGYLVGYDSYRFYVLLFLSINQFLVSFIQYLRSNIAGLQLFAIDSLLSVLDKTLMIIICGALLWGDFLGEKFGILHFVYGQTAAYALTALFVFVVVLVKAKQFVFKLKKTFVLMLLKQTLPFALLVLTMTFYYRLDAIMLDYILDDGEIQTAIYAQSYRLMDAATQVGVLFAGLLLPMFSYMIKYKESVQKLVKLSFTLIFIPSFVAFLICTFYSLDLMEVLYVDKVAESAKVLPILMGCFMAIASTYIFGTLLTANGSLKQLNTLALIGVVVNFGLNIILIPKYKAYGSAMASMLTQIAVVLVQIVLVKRIFKFDFNLKFLSSFIGFVGLCIAFVIMVGKTNFGWIYNSIGLVIFSLLLAFVVRLINLKEIKETFLKKPS